MSPICPLCCLPCVFQCAGFKNSAMRELLMETVTLEHYNLAGLEKIWKHYGYAPLIECVWERLQYVPLCRLYTVSDIERN